MIFKQSSKLPLAIGFTGLIILSQLMVVNMGYTIPWYFLIVLVILCFVIVWGMLVNDCIIKNDELIIKSGPFNNKIDIHQIERLIKNHRTLIKRKHTASKLTILYDENRRMTIYPIEKEKMIEALKGINSGIKIE